MGELPAWMRGRLENEIDAFIAAVPRIATVLSRSDIRVDEETVTAFAAGFATAYVGSLYRFASEDEVDQGAYREAHEVIRRRKPEIIGAFREELGDFE